MEQPLRNRYGVLLEVGQVYKNYKELCKALGETEKSGCSKRSQMKDWECYFTWENKGHKFEIKEIREVPLLTAAIGNEKFGHNIRTIILHELSMAHNREIAITKQNIFLKLGLVNDKFFYRLNSSNTDKKEYAVENSIRLKDVNDFFNLTYRNLLTTVKTALDKLADQRIIRYEDTYMLMFSSEQIADHDEYMDIMKIEFEVLEEYGLKTMWDATRLPADVKEEFYSKINNQVQEKLHCKYHYKIYHISAWEDVVNRVIEAEQLKYAINDLNQKMLKANFENAMTRYNENKDLWSELMTFIEIGMFESEVAAEKYFASDEDGYKGQNLTTHRGGYKYPNSMIKLGNDFIAKEGNELQFIPEPELHYKEDTEELLRQIEDSFQEIVADFSVCEDA